MVTSHTKKPPVTHFITNANRAQISWLFSSKTMRDVSTTTTNSKKERKKERKREKQKKGGTSLWFCINPNSSGHVHLNRTVAGWGRKEGKKNFLFAHCQFVDSPKGSFFLEAFQFLFSTIYTFFLREKKNDDNIQLPPEERAATQQQKRDDPQAENKELSLPLYAVTA